MIPNTSDNKLPKSELTKLRIIESFLKLIKKKRWDKLSVKEICAASNITRTTFYQYYEDIFDVMEKIQQKHLNALEKLSENCCLPAKSAQISSLDEFESRFNIATALDRAWYTYCAEYRPDFLALCHPTNGDDYFRIKLKTLWCTYINLSMDQDGFPKDSFRNHFLDLMFNNFFQSMYSWISTDNGERLSIDQLCDMQNAWRIGSAYLRMKENPIKN